MGYVPGWRKRGPHGRASWHVASVSKKASSRRSQFRQMMMILRFVHAVCRSNCKTEDVAGRRRLIYRVGVGNHTNQPTWYPSSLVVLSFPHSSPFRLFGYNSCVHYPHLTSSWSVSCSLLASFGSRGSFHPSNNRDRADRSYRGSFLPAAYDLWQGIPSPWWNSRFMQIRLANCFNVGSN